MSSKNRQIETDRQNARNNKLAIAQESAIREHDQHEWMQPSPEFAARREYLRRLAYHLAEAAIQPE